MAADPFYGPIVAKIDSILQQYSGFLDDNCKEWLICNMYKDPTKYSPHSNFLSAELSRCVRKIHIFHIFITIIITNSKKTKKKWLI